MSGRHSANRGGLIFVSNDEIDGAFVFRHGFSFPFQAWVFLPIHEVGLLIGPWLPFRWHQRCCSERRPFADMTTSRGLVAVHHAGRRLIVVPACSAIMERQDGVARKICWNGIRGGIVDLHHLIVVGEDRLGNAVDEVVRERSVGYDEIV